MVSNDTKTALYPATAPWSFKRNENDASSPKRVRRHSRQLSPAGGGQVPVNRIKRVTEQGQSCNGTVLSNKKQRRTGARTGVTHVPRGSQSPEKACLRRR